MSNPEENASVPMLTAPVGDIADIMEAYRYSTDVLKACRKGLTAGLLDDPAMREQLASVIDSAIERTMQLKAVIMRTTDACVAAVDAADYLAACEKLLSDRQVAYNALGASEAGDELIAEMAGLRAMIAELKQRDSHDET
jgi:hypothetical protein